MDPNKQIFLPVTGLSCNSHCIMCSVNSYRKDDKGVKGVPDGTTEQIIKDLIKGRKEGYDRTEFTGGEPTIREDITLLIKKAKQLGYKDIGISTNGILLGDKTFCDNIVKAGITNITFSLHAHNKKLYEYISRTPNAFGKTIKGIKNAVEHKNIVISVVTVVFSPNVKYLAEIGKLITSLGVSQWDLTDLLPDGRAKENYKNLCVKRSKLAKSLLTLIPLLNDFQSIVFFAFSPCVIPPEILHNHKVSIITAQQKLDVEKPLRYDKKELSGNSDRDDQNDIRQRKISICQNCIFSKECAGIWKDYLSLFGEKEIKKLALEHGCLESKIN